MALRSAPPGSTHTALDNLDSVLNFFEQYSQLENIKKLILQYINPSKTVFRQSFT
jgi:hypothetical protein